MFCHQRNLMFKKFVVALLFLAVASHASRAATLLDSQFKGTGTLDGWTSAVGFIDFGIATTGYLSGTAATNDPQLNHAKSIKKGGQDKWGAFTVRLRQLDDAGKPVEINESGMVLIFGKVPFSQATLVSPTGAGFVTLTYDLAGVDANESGVIRFDPIGNTISQHRAPRFEIDYIQVTMVPGS